MNGATGRDGAAIHEKTVRWLFATIVGAALALFHLPVMATTVASVGLHEMTAMADLVVDGWVAQVEAREEATTGGIYTYVTLEGLKVIHGTHLEPTLELRFSGGEVKGMHEKVFGMPAFTVGEHVLLFVQGNGSQICPLVGWQQGRLNVVIDPETGDEYLTDGKGHPVLAVDEEMNIRYGRAPGEGEEATALGGIPDDEPPASAIPLANTAEVAPMPLAGFLDFVDRLRGVAPAISPPSSSAMGQDVVPVDALAPDGRPEARTPVIQPTVPMAVSDPKTVNER